jgi:hypothetical protein
VNLEPPNWKQLAHYFLQFLKVADQWSVFERIVIGRLKGFSNHRLCSALLYDLLKSGSFDIREGHWHTSLWIDSSVRRIKFRKTLPFIPESF